MALRGHKGKSAHMTLRPHQDKLVQNQFDTLTAINAAGGINAAVPAPTDPATLAFWVQLEDLGYIHEQPDGFYHITDNGLAYLAKGV